MGEGGTAVDSALRALAQRDLSAIELERRLEAKGFAGADRAQAIETLARSGVVDDRRFAEGRARTLAARGAGDAAIRRALARAGIDRDAIEDALVDLDPERERARAVVERRGAGPKTRRYLRSKGFSEETIASVNGEELG